jgi:hypothetical protein
MPLAFAGSFAFFIGLLFFGSGADSIGSSAALMGARAKVLPAF